MPPHHRAISQSRLQSGSTANTLLNVRPLTRSMKAKLQKLEMLRGFAALYVFTGHFLLARVLQKESGSGFIFRFGQEAVMLFFIVSGFVVYYSTAKHGDYSFRPYFARRARRIFPIFFLALALSFITVFLLGHANSPPPSLWQLLGNLFMLQDFSGGKPGVWVSPFGGNLALWSLSYEWWFYMLFFPIYRFVPPKQQIHVVAAFSFVGFMTFSLLPNQVSLFLMYFVLWWSGAELGRSYLNQVPLTVTSQKQSIIYLTLLTALVATPVLSAVVNDQSLSFGIHPVLELRHFCACLLFLVIGLLWARMSWVGFRLIFGSFAFVAPISYALYVFHFPLAVTSSYLAGFEFLPLQLTGYVAITFLAAYIAEVPFQNWVNRKTIAFTQRPNHARHLTGSAVTACAPPPSPTARAAPAPSVAEL